MPPEQVGQFVDVASAVRRPNALVELGAYGILRELRDASVIDIGTGDGRLAFGAAIAGACSVVGLEPDPSALRAARRRARRLGLPHVTFERGAAQELGAHRDRYDVAILSWTL